jgi:hypothetical protein
MKKPSVFVASAREHVGLARAIKANLDRDGEVTLWEEGIFRLSSNAMESLQARLDHTDYGVFVCTPVDETTVRGATVQTARDNVILELGLVIGRLGRRRAFVVVPEGSGIHLPTDLLGTTPATYCPDWAQRAPREALGAACDQIRQAMLAHGVGDVWRTPHGFRLDVSATQAIEIVVGKIQDDPPQEAHRGVVLPTNTAFDCACVRDLQTALGAYFGAHFPDRLAEAEQAVLSAAAAERQRLQSQSALGAGTTLYLDCPLNTEHRIILTAVAEHTTDGGMGADIGTLVTSLNEVMRCAQANRLHFLRMPVLGTGLGGCRFEAAIVVTLAQICSTMLSSRFRAVQRVQLVVFDPNRRRVDQLEALARAIPLLRLV